jgi:hypothetical protein
MKKIALVTLFLIFWLINQTVVRAGKYEDIPDIPMAREAFKNHIFSGLKKSIGRSFYALSGESFFITIEKGSMFKVLEKETFVIIDVIIKNYPQTGSQTPYFKIKLASGRIGYILAESLAKDMATEEEAMKYSYSPRIAKMYRNLIWSQTIVPKVRNETLDKIIFQSMDWDMIENSWGTFESTHDAVNALKFQGYY